MNLGGRGTGARSFTEFSGSDPGDDLIQPAILDVSPLRTEKISGNPAPRSANTLSSTTTPASGFPPACLKVTNFKVRKALSVLRSLLDLAATNAGSTNAHPFPGALQDGMHGLQVQIPAPFGDIVRVTDPVAESWAAPANFTYFGHGRYRS